MLFWNLVFAERRYVAFVEVTVNVLLISLIVIRVKVLYSSLAVFVVAVADQR